MPGLDANTKLLLHGDGGDGVKSAFCHMKLEDNTDVGTGANAVTNIGTPTYTAGKINNALTLDGSTDALNVDALEVDIASDAVGSIAFWINPSDVTAAQVVFTISDASGGSYLLLQIFTGNLRVIIEDAPSYTYKLTNAISTGWSHWVITQDGSGVKVYKNATDITGSSTNNIFTGGEWINDLSGLDVGRIACSNTGGGGNTQFLGGQVDDFRYFKCALTQTEVNTLYNLTAGTEKSIIVDSSITAPHTAVQTFADASLDEVIPYAHYKMNDDAASTVVTDYGTGSNNGVATVNTSVLNATPKTGTGSFDFTATNSIYTTAFGAAIADDTTGTFAMWLEGGGNNDFPYFMGAASVEDTYMYIRQISGVTSVRLNRTSALFTASGTADITTGWHHIAVVQDGVVLKIYVDGELDTLSSTTGDTSLWLVDANVGGYLNDQSFISGTISSYPAGTGNYWGGQIDDFRYYQNVALTAEQVEALYNGGDGKESNAINYKWGGNSFVFNGTTDYSQIPDSADWDLIGSNSDDWTVDFQVKHADHAGVEHYVEQRVDNSNFWHIRHADGTGLRFFTDKGAGIDIDTGSGGEITDTNWHHVALCKVADEYGMYLDGTQVNYTQNTSTQTYAAVLTIAAAFAPGITNQFNGNMDEFRIQKSNYFGAAPNVGLTDTITVPTEAYSEASIVGRSQAVIIA